MICAASPQNARPGADAGFAYLHAAVMASSAESSMAFLIRSNSSRRFSKMGLRISVTDR